MQKSIVQPEELLAAELFNDTSYIIPIYQRNYAWGTGEIEQLLDDISGASYGDGCSYYIGNLIVNQIDNDLFEVIDGQQRLTTLFLLLSFLDCSSIRKNSLRFEARDRSNRTLECLDLLKDDPGKLGDYDYSNEILDGYSIIERYFSAHDDAFKDSFRKKLGRIAIIRTQVPCDIDLNHYFEVMNTRGEQLELHEIAKARIIGAIKTGDDISEQDKKDVAIASRIWDACSQMDKYVQMCFDISTARKKLFGDDWDSFKCNSFSDLRPIFDCDSPFDDMIPLKEILKGSAGIEGRSEDSREEQSRFESIISFPNFLLQVNKAMNLSGEEDDASLDDKRFLVLLERHWSSKECALDFIFSMLRYRYLFDKYIIKREYQGQYKTDGRWSLQRLYRYKGDSGDKPAYSAAFSFSRPEDDSADEASDNHLLSLLESCLRITYTSPRAMHWVAIVLNEAGNKADCNRIISTLERYCCGKVAAADYLVRKGFAIDRIVFSYLDYILYRDNRDKFKDFQFQFRNSIEHFFPQNPMTDDDSVSISNRDSFGNLALITVSANSKFSNLLPRYKIEFSNIISQSPKLRLMKDLLEEHSNCWDDACVDRHNAEMLALLRHEIDKHGGQS